MNKLIGAVLIAVVCTYYGFAASDRLMRRKDFLGEFLNSLSLLETEICFGRYDLKSVFKKMNNKKLFGVYTECAENVSELGIKAAWKKSVEKASSLACLKEDDVNACKSLGAELGMSDVEGQKKAIARTAQFIKRYLENAEEEYFRLGRVYKRCGVLAGIFVVIVFI